ncbi:base non-specific and adenylic acid preferential ribonuclease [Lactarius quietus]|nr:base non-specific and adenylic acid preferential ribonuclease [Lactarius quietus]
MIALLALLANVAVTLVSAQDLNNIHRFNKRLSSGCGLDWPVSCSANPPPSDLCCYESPGGLLLQTQFWDTNPSTGPSNSWNIHGLWPDNCDGTYSENCDPSRDYTDITGLLTSQGAGSTLSFMEEYWISDDESNEDFWEHEWVTHGTCYSTLEPSCLPSGSPTGAEAVAFFEQVVALFQTLPTYSWLESQGITPSTTKTHTLSQLNSALKAASGVRYRPARLIIRHYANSACLQFTPALGCSGTTIDSISWYFNLQGSLLDGEFIPIDSPVASTCASSGLKYPPKS